MGYGDGAMYVGTDALALAPFTKRVSHLEDDDWVVLRADGCKVYQHAKEVTREIRHHLLRGQLLECGRLIDEAWHAKRRLSPLISSVQLDAIYDLAKANGAVGGKLLGAGGGGYFIFFVRPFQRYPLIAALEQKGLSCSRIAFEEHGLRTWKSRIPGAPAKGGGA